ncbi:MAG: adenosylcobinamide-GDP ribazoletransferase [Epulopiscium sp.]|nr:adenosylcobinamide-GDP ribazoletransferase [Candidatus Epulonipiscium sp.]
MKSIILTFQFLTRIPLPITIDIQEDSFVKGIVCFPIVGLVVGLYNVLIYFFLCRLLPKEVVLIFAILANISITGALHVDGLADTCDGIFSTRKAEHMLEIMRDSRIGTHGTLGIIFDLLFRYTILIQILKVDPEMLKMALLLSPVASRTVMGLCIYFSTYARKEGLGGLYLSCKKIVPTICCGMIGFVFFVCFLEIRGIFILISSTVVGFLIKYVIERKIGGMTGDTLGAIHEVVEVICLLLFLIIEC